MGFNIIAMTAIATLAISILAVLPIPIFHPPIFWSTTCTWRQQLSCWWPKVLQALLTRRRLPLLWNAALITSTGRHQALSHCSMAGRWCGLKMSCSLFFPCKRCSTHWMTGNNVVYKTKRERSNGNNQQQQGSCSLFVPLKASFNPLDGREQHRTTERKESNPTRQSTKGVIPQQPSTRTIRHCQEKAITNCVLLLSNWSKWILRRNNVEYIPNCKCEIHVFYKNGEMQAPPLSYVFYSGKQSQD